MYFTPKHDNENERGQMSPRQGEKGENTPFTKNVGKKSVNDAGPQQGHDTSYVIVIVFISE